MPKRRSGPSPDCRFRPSELFGVVAAEPDAAVLIGVVAAEPDGAVLIGVVAAEPDAALAFSAVGHR